ncbi:MAG: cation:proton antiporter [Oscillospiraceae bacterium]|nr:cation:proton antiporter [Oscillospiraceae bacterium]
MLVSIGIILLVGMFLGFLSRKISLPPLVGMILTGVIIGPHALGLIDRSLLEISGELRQIALVIILTRAGLSLDINQLRKAGISALLMCFVPATFEIAATVIFAPMLFGISYLEAALAGTVLAAVSPAVVVPRMIKLIDEGWGTDKQIPQIIVGGASADDVYVIVLFTSFLAILSGGSFSAVNFVQIPTSIILGALFGAAVGLLLVFFFGKVHMRDSAKVIVIISVSFLTLGLETFMEQYVRISGLIAIMAMGMTFLAKRKELAKRLSAKYNKLWIAAEIMLFVLVGAAVDLKSILSYGLTALLLLFIAIIFRMAGVYVSLLGTKLSFKERLFCMLAYTPKATVQAAIGAIPLSAGLDCGGLILTLAVLAILVTAPLGAFMIDFTYEKWLTKSDVD